MSYGGYLSWTAKTKHYRKYGEGKMKCVSLGPRDIGCSNGDAFFKMHAEVRGIVKQKKGTLTLFLAVFRIKIACRSNTMTCELSGPVETHVQYPKETRVSLGNAHESLLGHL